MDKMQKQFVDDLLKKRIIYLQGEIVSSLAADIGKAIVWLNAQDGDKEITLYIDSGGGGVTAGLDIYHMIKHSKSQVTGIVYRTANSMASVILQACAKRQALKSSEFVLHYTTSRPIVRINRDTVEELIDKNIRKTLEISLSQMRQILQIYMERSGMLLSNVKRLLREGKTLDTDETLKLGLIDEII